MQSHTHTHTHTHTRKTHMLSHMLTHGFHRQVGQVDLLGMPREASCRNRSGEISSQRKAKGKVLLDRCGDLHRSPTKDERRISGTSSGILIIISSCSIDQAHSYSKVGGHCDSRGRRPNCIHCDFHRCRNRQCGFGCQRNPIYNRVFIDCVINSRANKATSFRCISRSRSNCGQWWCFQEASCG